MSTIRRSTLENGVRVVTDTMPEMRSVAIGVLVDVGPAVETPHTAGASHLCEHLLFQGTSNRDALEIARFIDSAGGRIGGFTSRDYTCFYGVVQAEFQTFVLDLMGDIMLNSIFPQEALEREQRAIVCEIEAAADDPEEQAHQRLKELVWRGDPLGSAITGSAADVMRLTREDLIYFTHGHYAPEQIVVAAAGNVDHDDFAAQVRDGFWRLLPTEGPKPASKATVFQSGFCLEHKAVSQAYFALALEAPAYTHPDRYLIHTIAQVIGGGLSSRLFRRLREQEGLVYSITTAYHAYRRGGMLVIEGCTAPQHLLTVLELTLEELVALAHWQRPPDAEELQRAKAQLRGQIMLASDDSHSRMSRLATQELYFQEVFTEEELLSEIEAVSLDRLEHLASERLRPALAGIGTSLVAAEAPNFYDEERIEEILRRYGVIRPAVPDLPLLDRSTNPAHTTTGSVSPS